MADDEAQKERLSHTTKFRAADDLAANPRVMSQMPVSEELLVGRPYSRKTGGAPLCQRNGGCRSSTVVHVRYSDGLPRTRTLLVQRLSGNKPHVPEINCVGPETVEQRPPCVPVNRVKLISSHALAQTRDFM